MAHNSTDSSCRGHRYDPQVQETVNTTPGREREINRLLSGSVAPGGSSVSLVSYFLFVLFPVILHGYDFERFT